MAEQAELYIGDKVRIKDDCQSTDFLLFAGNMEQYEGREAYIVSDSRYYTLDIDNGCYSWCSEWLEFVDDISENDIASETELLGFLEVQDGT